MTPKRITVHCAATPDGVRYPAARIREIHIKERGFTDIGYHFVIQPDGEIELGRPITIQGAHVQNHDEDNVGICLIGCNKFTLDQFTALRRKLDLLLQTYKILGSEIYCHYEWDSAQKQGKTCPNIKSHNLLWWYFGRSAEAIAPYLL